MTASPPRPPVVARTRLRPPVPQPDDVRRSRLLARLDATREPVILVAAPRGAGKTVLLAQWAGPRRSAWVSLSRHDYSPAAVWSATLESLRPYCPRLPAFPAARLDDQATLFGEVIPELLNALASAGPLVLVLDGLDVVDHPVTRTTLDELVRRIPDAIRVVLATARPPAGPVAALRAAGRLAELGPDDLRLDAGETRQLLTATARRPVGAAEAAAVWRDYDGWATGVRLAGLARRDQPPGTRRPHPLPGVEDFFRAEVLERVTSRQRRLLLYSSVLAELTPERCAEVTQVPAAGQELAALAASSLLLRRADSGWQCHPVLRSVLASVLAAEEADKVPVLHARAARRMLREGDQDAAYEQARLAGRPDLALRAAIAPWPAADPRRLLARLDGLPHAAATGTEAIAAAAELAAGSPAGAARRLADAADRPAQTADRLPDADHFPARAVRAWLAVQRGDLVAARLHATDVVAAAGGERAWSWWLALADAALGTVDVWEGHAAGAVDRLAGVARDSEEAGYRDVAVRALDAQTAGLLLTGDPAAALASARRAVAWHELDPARCAAPVIARAYLAATSGAGLAAVPWTTGEAAESQAPHAEAFSSLLLAQAASARGDTRQARSARAHAQAALAGLSPGPVLTALLAGQWPGGLQDLRPAVLSDRERAVLRALSGPLTLREIAAELNVSHNTVKAHVQSVFRKLGAHDRAAAVARGALLPHGIITTPHRTRCTRADRGRARRNRGAPAPRSAPRAGIRAPTSPGRTAASPGPPALAQAPTARRASPSTASPPARRPARPARPAPRRGSGSPPGPGPAPAGQGRARRPARAP
ncbi:MAG TPA: LuxR C-terminal-related transcriptional regulator [Trebonia sp.]|nr:LuxR C-terminal-related transcriptional regulator [Trebonia sp.]